MQTMNFSEKALLKSLMDKTKTTTIRKAWQNKPLEKVEDKMLYSDELIEKPCKYKVGEIVELVWTGEGLVGMNHQENNVFGKVKITCIEKIKISRGYGFEETNLRIEEIKVSEGLDSITQMKDYLESYAPEIIDNRMPFYLIRWEWL